MKRMKDFGLNLWNQNKMTMTSLFVMATMYYPIGLLHEFGHYLIGWKDGATCIVYWWLAGHCKPLPENVMLYWALGGLFGMIGSFSILVFKKVRINKGILLGVLTLGFSQFINFFFETFAHFAYLNNTFASMLMAVSIGLVFVSLLRFFNPRSKK